MPDESGKGRGERWAPRARADLRSKRIGSEAVILDRASNQVHQLNHTANFIWERCDGKRTVDEISEEVGRHFEIERQVARRDTEKIVGSFEELGLLER